jgi:hypothetical protein
MSAGRRKTVKTLPGHRDPGGAKERDQSPAEGEGGGGPTVPSPPPDEAVAASPSAAEPSGREASSPPTPQSRSRTPLIEIEVVHEVGPAPQTERPWRMVEIWTRNRVYTLDQTMACVEVVDRATRKQVTDHPFLGLRMVGGQHRDGDSIELSHPFPRPGTEAVFEHRSGRRDGSFSRTSAVTRVILRLHIVTVAPNYVVPTWEDITGSFPAAYVVRKDG